MDHLFILEDDSWRKVNRDLPSKGMYLLRNLLPSVNLISITHIITYMEYTTVSAKIPIGVKEKLAEYGIKPSEVIRKAIYDEIKKAEMKRLKKESESIESIIYKIPNKFVVKSIREDRER